MTDTDYPTQKTSRGDALLALGLSLLVVAIAWYFKSAEFAAWVDGYRDQALGLMG